MSKQSVVIKYQRDAFAPVGITTSTFFLFGATAPCGPGPPHSRGFYITNNDAPQSVGLLWTCDKPVAETST
jgi:hypothetical protein